MSGAVPKNQLSRDERLFYRDRLRAARYAALADSEGFEQVCFAVEALGMRRVGEQKTMGGYQKEISLLAAEVGWFSQVADRFPGMFTRFPALYEKLRKARNDVMHTGAYARNATSAAIELCILLEEAVMNAGGVAMEHVEDFMVREVLKVEAWQPVAHARQLMLMHSFSFLPVRINNGWKLISEMSIASFLRSGISKSDRNMRLAMSIADAVSIDSRLACSAKEIRPDTKISKLFDSPIESHGRLWLVTQAEDPDRLLGVLTPFELM